MKNSREVDALIVHQWLRGWDAVRFNPKENRRKPEPHFYLFTLPAAELKALSGIYRRTTAGGQLRSDDLGIQRRHDEERSTQIGKYVNHGYPWSELTERQRKSDEYDDLRKPGWLPTAIVINVLGHGDKRRGKSPDPSDLIEVHDIDHRRAVIHLPSSFDSPQWKPKNLPPIEVIDGQHRLWAFDETFKADFDLPVVAFYGLDISWQAYLFWSINITPKKINASLAFDLYPLLRTEDWLERFEGHSIYRETRAQELTEALWSHPESPWHNRINMLGEAGERRMATQASWIRTLLATYVKKWDSGRSGIGGLFGAPLRSHDPVLPWTRAQQAAFLIFMGNCFRNAVKRTHATWAKELRKVQAHLTKHTDPAFEGDYSLINTDQGIRGLLYVTNDLCYLKAEDLDLQGWQAGDDAAASDAAAVTAALKSIDAQPVAQFLEATASHLASFDWRASSAPGLSDSERLDKAALRGAGGYKELRRMLLAHVAQKTDHVGKTAADAITLLKY
jgi:DGQHR domain-containing protein